MEPWGQICDIFLDRSQEICRLYITYANFFSIQNNVMYCVWVHFVFQKCTYLFTYLVLECSSLIDYGPCTRPPHFPCQNIRDKHNLTLLTFTTFWHKYINSALLNMLSNYNIHQCYYVRHCYSSVWLYVLVVSNNDYKIMCRHIPMSVSSGSTGQMWGSTGYWPSTYHISKQLKPV